MHDPDSVPNERSDSGVVTVNLLDLVERVVRELHPGRAHTAMPTLDSALERELALDSLARVELGARIELTFACTLPETALFEAETPRDLLRAILKASGGRISKVPVIRTNALAAEIVALPTQAETLIDMLSWHCERHGDRSHIQFYDEYTDGEILSYRALWDGACAVAAGLQARDLEPGDRVALMLPTGRDYFFAFFGTLLAGAVPVPIYPPVRRAQLEDHLLRQSRILTNCGARCLITTADAGVMAQLLTASVASLQSIVSVPELLDSGARFERATRQAHDLAFIQYTSGSTGDPKGVALTHANLLANIRVDGQGLGATPADVFVSWLPLYHDMGLIGAWLGSLYHAVRFVVMPPLTFLARPERWLHAIHRYHGTLSAAPNFAYELCLTRINDADIEGIDLSHWRVAANGAEAISVKTMEGFCARFARYGFRREAMMPVYGLAECAVGLAFTPLGRGPKIDRIRRDVLARDGRAEIVSGAAPEAVREVVACGLPLPGHELRIVDDADRELPERREGRVHFRGPSATSGYYANPNATTTLLRNGWLETGDRGYIASGELYLTGRSKDIIIRAGRNIYPTELEDEIGNLDGVRKGHVAIFGSVSAELGTERLVALVETRKRTDAARNALHQAIDALASDVIGMPLDEVVFAPPNSVLRTSSGKIRRAACRAVYEAGEIGQSAKPAWVQVLRLALAGVAPQMRRARHALASWLYAGWAWCMLATLGTIAWLLTWLPLPRESLWKAARLCAQALAFVTLTRASRAGFEHLPDRRQGALVVANHQSYLDGIVLYACLPRPPRFLVKAELKNSIWLARPLARLGALFIERFDASGGIASLAPAAQALVAGALVVVFPEGTFKRMPGLLPFRMGAFTLAAETGAKLLPLALRGTRSMLRADSWFPRHGAITLTLAEPLITLTNQPTWDAAIALRDATRAHMLQYTAEPDLAHESNRVEPKP